MWTKVKWASWIWSALAVVISVITLVSSFMWWIWNEALADNKVDTLWEERTQNQKDYDNLKDNLSKLQTDIAVIKNDTVWIKEYLKSK